MTDARRIQPERMCISMIAAAAILPVSATFVAQPSPRLLWNVSASTPKGLYAVHLGVTPKAGDMVVAFVPNEARMLAASRRYLPLGVPLVKRVAAASGDRVCARADLLFINRRFAARRQEEDSNGRILPHWSGCITLRPGEYLLLGDHLWSFDGRYFGVTGAKEIIGRANLLWPG